MITNVELFFYRAATIVATSDGVLWALVKLILLTNTQPFERVNWSLQPLPKKPVEFLDDFVRAIIWKYIRTHTIPYAGFL